MAIRFGTSVGDRLRGSNGTDLIRGYEGDDLLIGDDDVDSGNDLMIGDEGNDTFYGGVYDDSGETAVSSDSGSDTMLGGEGDDVFHSGGGADLIDGGDGYDMAYIDRSDLDGGMSVFGNGFGGRVRSIGSSNSMTISDGSVVGDVEGLELTGTDFNDTIFLANNYALEDVTVYGGQGNDNIVTGDSEDVIEGGEGRDIISMGAGDDTADGGEGRDIIDGGAGNDSIIGGGNNDILSGGEGEDVLLGGSGEDVLIGGAGADELDGGEGFDTYTGGEGADSFLMAWGEMEYDLVTDYDSVNDTITVAFGEGITEEDVLISVLSEEYGLVSVQVTGEDDFVTTEYFIAQGVLEASDIDTSFVPLG